MQKSGFNSKKFAQDVARDLRKTLIAAYPGAWEFHTDKRGTKWFYTIDLMDGDARSGLAVGPALGTHYIAFIATKETANALQGADPVELVANVVGDIQNTIAVLQNRRAAPPETIDALHKLHGRMIALLGIGA